MMDNDTTHLTGVFVGTVTHLAPEALQTGRQSLAVDVYAFGILLCELVSGRKVYPGKTAAWIVDAVVNKHHRPSLPPTTPPGVLKLVHRCTEHDPALRPSMEEVATTLRELLYPDGQGSSTTRRLARSRPSPSKTLSSRSISERLGLGSSASQRSAVRREVSFKGSFSTCDSSLPQPSTPSITAQQRRTTSEPGPPPSLSAKRVTISNAPPPSASSSFRMRRSTLERKSMGHVSRTPSTSTRRSTLEHQSMGHVSRTPSTSIRTPSTSTRTAHLAANLASSARRDTEERLAAARASLGAEDDDEDEDSTDASSDGTIIICMDAIGEEPSDHRNSLSSQRASDFSAFASKH